MSEEEIINKIKEIIEVDKNAKIVGNNKIVSIYEELFLKDYLQGILDLYQKEKDKNKKLNKYITDKVKIGKEIQTFINKGYVEQEYISKDKIREKQDKYKNKIERLESKKIWNEPVDTIKKNRYTNYYNAYEELLEEK